MPAAEKLLLFRALISGTRRKFVLLVGNM